MHSASGKAIRPTSAKINRRIVPASCSYILRATPNLTLCSIIYGMLYMECYLEKR